MKKFTLLLSLLMIFSAGIVFGTNSDAESRKEAAEKARLELQQPNIITANTFPAPVIMGDRETFFEIGDPTTTLYNTSAGAFYDYYYSHRSQILYLASEFGNPMLITKLAWNFYQAPGGVMNNFVIKIIETSDDALTAGAWYDWSAATEVYSQASGFVPTTATGWATIDIADYVYTGVNNLIVQVEHANPGFYNYPYNYTYRSTGSVNRTLYGYQDAAPPITYDYATNYYDNLGVYWEPLSAPATIQGFVYTTGGTPLQGAQVQIEDVAGVPTDATGYYSIGGLFEGVYDVWASYDGYSPSMQTVNAFPGGSYDVDFYLGQPILTISPLIMENTLNPGEWFTDYISMLNTGDGASYFNATITYTTGNGWLSLSDDQGMVAAGGGSFNLGVNFDAADLAPGTVFDATITLDFAPTSQVNIPVTMVVAGDPLPAVEEFHATLADPVTGKVYCTWDFNPDVTFQYFEIRRDGAVLGITTELTYIDFLPDYGSYMYSVSAVYDEGMSTAQFDDVDWFIPVLCYTPTAPEENVMINQTEDTFMTVENCGQGTLSWSIAGPGFYQVALYDSYGDGWNGGSLDIHINGTTVLSGLTIISGSGPEYHSFPVEEGDEITTTYYPGSWTTENSYEILNEGGDVIYTSPNTSIPAGVLFVGPLTNFDFGFITSINPMSGTLEEGETAQVRFTYDATGYSVGTYTVDTYIKTNEQVPGNSHLVTHTMNVYIPGMIAGNVTDCNTAMGLNNVSVRANNGAEIFYGETNANGYYEIFVDAGTFDMDFSLLGYQMETASGVVVTTGNTTTQNASMCEEAYPVSGVFADPNEADTQCLVTWNLPAGPYTIIYDDGSAEDFAAWVAPGGAVAVKFSPAGYPASVIGGKVYVGDGFFPEGGNWLGTDIAVGVADDDGTNGMPGTIIDSLVVTVNNYGWVDFGLSGSTFVEGDFYLVMWQLGVAPDVAPIGIDTDQPTVYRSYAMQAGGDWFFSPYQDYMIRASVSGPTNSVSMNATTTQRMVPPKAPQMDNVYLATSAAAVAPGFVKTGTFVTDVEAMSTRDLNKYNVFRMFGFDPDAGEGPADGAPTGVGSTSGLSKNDTQFGSQTPGFYAYAVEAEYDSGDKSTWAYSNIVAHGLDNVVTITAAQCDGGEPSDVEVTLVGHNYPYQVLFGVSGADGVVVFDSVIDGMYDIAIFKVAYQHIYLNDVAIYNDYSVTVTLQENAFPARNLYVDALTSVATWDEARIEQISMENFEGTFPPAGWTTFSNDPTSSSAWNKWNAYTGAWPIPPQFEDGTSSYFAAAISDANSIHDGSMDLLITPMLDLRESETFALYFDSFFDAAYGQLAYVEYSTDAGTTWQLLHNMIPTPGTWTENTIDLSALSGIPAGNGQIWFSFHADDQNAYLSGWAVDNVSVHNGAAPILGYYVYLDDGFVAMTPPEVMTYTFGDLVYGQEYTAKVRAVYSCGLSDPIDYTWTSTYLHPPRNLGDEYIYNTNEVPLMWNPPMMGDGVPMMMASSFVPKTGQLNNQEVDADAVSRDVAASRDLWDLQYAIDIAALTGAAGNAGAGSDGEFIYATRWASNLIEKFTVDGVFVEEFSIPGVSGLRDLAYDGTYFYGAAAGTTVWQMDFTNHTLVSTISAPTACRALAYDEETNTLWGNNWATDIVNFDLTGAATGEVIVAPPSMYGAAFDNYTDGGPFMWVFSGTTGGGGCQIEQIDMATGALTGEVHSVSDVLGITIAGGLYIQENIIEGFLTIGGTAQGDGAADTGFGFELGAGTTPGGVPEGLMSFNLYRDADFIDNVPYEGQGTEDFVTYVNNPVDPGTYMYDVSAVYDLSVFGFIGETGESMWEGTDTVTVAWGIDLPFFEDWAQGSFDFQGWRSEDANWKMNSSVGNDQPSAEFSWDPLLEEDYSASLTTNPLKADMLTEGDIFVDFDLKLADRNATGEEMLQVEVKSANGGWDVIETFANTGSFDFTSYHIAITGAAMGEVFQVRFNAIGQNSFDIVGWYVDNIHVYRECAAPYDLTGEYYWNDSSTGDDFGAEICWEAPELPIPIYAWIHWDSGDNMGAIGLTAEGPFSVAARWDAGMLADYDGTFITKIRFFPSDDGFSTITLKVWYGPEASMLVAEKEVALADVTIGMYNEVELDTPIEVDAGDELWVGYTIVQVGTSVFPAGHDEGPAIAGYGDKVSLDGSTWDNLSDFGPDFDVNWNVQAYVQELTTAQPAITPLIETAYNSEGSSFANTTNDELIVMEEEATRDFTGFNVYRMAPGETEYTPVGTVTYVEGQTAYCYEDAINDEQLTGVYSYQVTANWVSATDACESNPGMDVAMVNDYVYVDVTNIDNPNAMTTQLYPNPATDRVQITSTQEMSRITVINYVGQVVYQSELSNQTALTLNTASYENGVYVVRLETENDVITKRFVIAQ